MLVDGGDGMAADRPGGPLNDAGQTFVKADGVYTYEHRITTVDATADVVSAIDEVTSNSPTGVPVRSQRALGVAKDCIVVKE